MWQISVVDSFSSDYSPTSESKPQCVAGNRLVAGISPVRLTPDIRRDSMLVFRTAKRLFNFQIRISPGPAAANAVGIRQPHDEAVADGGRCRCRRHKYE